MMTGLLKTLNQLKAVYNKNNQVLLRVAYLSQTNLTNKCQGHHLKFP
jgi:hypothetical protein